MSSIKAILDEAKKRCEVLREHIDRGRYDGKLDAVQEKLEEIISDGQDKITKFYKKQHGMMYKLKSKNNERSEQQKLYEIVLSHENDLTNRQALLNYLIINNIQDPNKCRNMSQEKCGRAKNTRICQWVPGADELAEWGVTDATVWNLRKKPDNLPEYIGKNVGQKPRGCYPTTKRKTDMKAFADVRKHKEGVAFGLKSPPKDDLTEAERAEAEIQRKPLTEAQKEKMQKKKLQYAEMLKKLRATKSVENLEETYETKGKGGRKKRTKKRKTKKRKTRKRKKTRRHKKKRRTKRRKR